MNPLLKRLAALRWKVRLLDGWQGLCAMVALVLGVGVFVGTLDYWAHLPSLFRAASLVGLLVSTGYIAYMYLVVPFSKRCDDLNLALRIEEAYPELNDSLASTVQFLKQSKEEQERVGGSDAMREQTVQTATEKAAQCDFSAILDRKAALLFGIGAFSIAILAGLVVWLYPASSQTAFWRLVEPFGGHTWTRVVVERSKGRQVNWEPIDPRSKEEDRIAHNQPYRIKVELQGKLPRQAKVEIKSESEISGDLVIDADKMKAGSQDGSLSFETPIHMGQIYKKIKFRVLANDGTFPARGWHEVEVLPNPKIVEIDGRVEPPSYTDLPAKALASGARHLQVFEGSKVFLRAKADRPLTEAWLEIHPEKPAKNADDDKPDPKAEEKVVVQKVPATIDATDGSIFTLNFIPPVKTDVLNIHLRDIHGLDADEKIDVKVQPDPLPEIKLIRPGATVTAVPDAEITFKFRVTDEFFAIRSVFVEYHLRAEGGELKGEPKKRVLYGSKEAAELVPFLSPETRLRPKGLDFERIWPLRNEFKPGDQVVVVIRSDDFFDLDKNRKPGRSDAIELRIIGRRDLAKKADDAVTEIQKKLQDLEKREQKNMELVKELTKKEKLTDQEKQQLIEAEQNQRQIQEEIGKAPDQGLRRDLRDLRQLLRDNKETNSKAFKESGKMQGTLDHIAQQELPQIEPKFAEARSEATQDDKISPKTKEKLEETAKLQDNVVKAIRELNKELAPDAAMQQHTDKIREILAEQERIKQELQELQEERDLALENKVDPKQVDDRMRKEIGRLQKEQQELHQKTQKAMQEMENALQDAKEKGDRQNAQKLEDALKNAGLDPNKKKNNTDPMPKQQDAKKEPLSTKMKNIADALKEKKEVPPQAIEQQKDVAQDLDKVLDALEQRNQDITKEELKERQDAQKKMDQFAKDLQKLRDEVKKLDKIENMEERLKKQKELVEKHENLKAEMEKAERELARLQEHQAANNVKDAIDNVEKAKKNLQQGGDPQQAEKQDRAAQEKIKDAKMDLQESEQELARELLIKIADKLKGLKERQEALVQRSEDFHSRLMRVKQWRDGNLDSIEGNIDAQKGIAVETDDLKEKLKEAKVFHSILERARESMDQAAKVMEERRDGGKELRNDDGIKLEEKDLKHEGEAHADTIKHQTQAAKRLDRLLESLKEHLAKKPPQPRDERAQNDENPKEPKEEKKQGGLRAQDGIPPMAQLKALKAEQLDINERTEDFARRHPDVEKLNDAQKTELADLFREQDRLDSLFREITAQAEPMNQDVPEPKEGVKK